MAQKLAELRKDVIKKLPEWSHYTLLLVQTIWTLQGSDVALSFSNILMFGDYLTTKVQNMLMVPYVPCGLV